MRWLSPDGLSIFWISFQGECLVMTGARETNIIMCSPSLLKMGLMTGRASRTHTRPGPRCGHLCACSFTGCVSLQNKIHCTFAPTWHNWQWNHTRGKTHTEHTPGGLGVSLPTYNRHYKVCLNFERRLFSCSTCISLSSRNLLVLWSSLSFSIFVNRVKDLTFTACCLSSPSNAGVMDRLAHQDPDFTHLPAWGQS